MSELFEHTSLIMLNLTNYVSGLIFFLILVLVLNFSKTVSDVS